MAQQGYPGAPGPYGYPQQQPGGPPTGKPADRVQNSRVIHLLLATTLERAPDPVLQGLDRWHLAGTSRSSRA